MLNIIRNQELCHNSIFFFFYRETMNGVKKKNMFNIFKNQEFFHESICFFFFYREAARECRRKKKEYVKCLENRVAVLENQNKTLIEELKALKELYCQKDA